jgi:galactose mutarotase-like enzyme
MQPVEITAHSQQHQGQSFHHLANADDGFAIEPVSGMPDHQGEQEHGQKLHQPNHAQGKRAVR